MNFLGRWFIPIGAFVVLASAGPLRANLPSLGLADDYAIYGSDTEILINSVGTAVFGNVALGPGGSLNFLSGTINGSFFYDDASVLNFGSGVVTGGQFLIDPTPIQDDAHAAAAAANLLLPTQNFNSLGNGQTVFGTGGLNVISVNTNIVLTNGGVLTLFGNGNDEFLFNINGTMTLTGASSINLIGVSPEQVLWNFVGAGNEVLLDSSTGVGNILAIERNIRLEGSSHLGSLISNGEQIKLQAGSEVFVIPEPTTGLLALTALGLISLRRRKTV
jgi:hypothetical protein